MLLLMLLMLLMLMMLLLLLLLLLPIMMASWLRADGSILGTTQLVTAQPLHSVTAHRLLQHLVLKPRKARDKHRKI
jgi:hypothetical protein